MSGQGIGEILTTIASLTPAQQSVLKKVSLHAGPVTITDLARESKLHVNTIREPLNVLVSLGLVEREKLPAAGRGRPYWGYTSRTLSGPNSPADLLRHLSRSTIRWIRDTSDDPVAAARSLGEHLGDDALAMANVPDHTEHSPSDKFSLADHMTKIRVFLTVPQVHDKVGAPHDNHHGHRHLCAAHSDSHAGVLGHRTPADDCRRLQLPRYYRSMVPLHRAVSASTKTNGHGTIRL